MDIEEGRPHHYSTRRHQSSVGTVLRLTQSYEARREAVASRRLRGRGAAKPTTNTPEVGAVSETQVPTAPEQDGDASEKCKTEGNSEMVDTSQKGCGPTLEGHGPTLEGRGPALEGRGQSEEGKKDDGGDKVIWNGGEQAMEGGGSEEVERRDEVRAETEVVREEKAEEGSNMATELVNGNGCREESGGEGQAMEVTTNGVPQEGGENGGTSTTATEGYAVLHCVHVICAVNSTPSGSPTPWILLS